MKNGFKSSFAYNSCVLFVALAVTQAATAQSTSRGMQTAPPRQTYESQSPRVIDFLTPGTNRNNGNVIDFSNPRNNSINPQAANRALGNRQIPLQNMPFGERSPTQAQIQQAQQALSNSEQNVDNFANSGRNAIQKVNDAGKRFWQNAAKPFKQESAQFNLPANLNRKGNYTENQRLTDLNPMADRFKLPTLEKPAWMKKIDDRAKNLLGRKNELQQQGSDLVSRINGTRQNASQAWQGFNQDNASGNAQPNAQPAARSANNSWLDNAQNAIRR